MKTVFLNKKEENQIKKIGTFNLFLFSLNQLSLLQCFFIKYYALGSASIKKKQTILLKGHHKTIKQ